MWLWTTVKSPFKGNQSRPWTEKESETLINLHINCELGRMQGWSREDCERHWKELYFSLFNDERCVADAIDAYYENGKTSRDWDKWEIQRLFFDPDFCKTTGRTKKEYTVHFYTILGMNFQTEHTSIKEGISAAVKAYHANHTSKPGTEKLKQE
ncbi:hypothetical protein K469DRAFT_690730 [Zopfia rhizophila CBS 207.26]|uniref:Myb-like domain-containing protein n=1 Tax=Zopfia rhizophila CBS 207.26 TaxID=1314779 RepID=A0A6A6DSP7_9PEZI|nr:hypothetical protein K469DRAFT_690730 [Zopfia rhizophila CBS 207.26]